MDKNETTVKCCMCGAEAVALFPVWEIDQEVPPKPYCNKCLHRTKREFFLQILTTKNDKDEDS